MTAYEMRISDWSSDVCSSDLSHAILYTLARNRPRLGIDRKHRIDAFRRGRSIARQRISDDCGNFKKSDCPREKGGHRDLVGGIEDRRPRAVRLERFSCQSERGKTFEVRRFEVESAERREIERRHCRFHPVGPGERVRDRRARSDERRVGKEGVSTGRFRWSAYPEKKKKD